MISHDIVQKFDIAIDHFAHELSQLRTGRATPLLIENVKVMAYGVETPLNQLANISTPDSKSLAIQPWDKNVIQDVEKALEQADLGAKPVVTGNLIRLSLPPMTEERRKEITKIANQKTEEAKVAVRMVREAVIRNWKEDHKSGAISEDDFHGRQKKLQEVVDEYNEKIRAMYAKKEEEILSI